MAKKTFESGDAIGRYAIDEFGGTNESGESFWWVTDQDGKARLLPEKKLRAELARAEWTPEKIRSLSSRAYDELRKEIGDDGIEELLTASKQKKEVPTNVQQREIAEKWFAWHPQIPRTRSNTTLFDEYLAKMPNPTFDSRDFDLAFSDCFLKLEINPSVCGITGYGEAIQGWEAVETLTSSQVQQLQKSFPVTVNAGDLTPKQALQVVADSMTAQEFVDWTKKVDAENGAQPIPPLVLQAREQTWSQFFQLHTTVTPTAELKDKLLEYLTKNGLSFALQHLGLALQSLIEQKDKSVVEQESGVHAYGGTNLVTCEPRPRPHVVPFDDVPVTVTTAEINAMDSETYNAKLKNPNFEKAVNRLLRMA